MALGLRGIGLRASYNRRAAAAPDAAVATAATAAAAAVSGLAGCVGGASDASAVWRGLCGNWGGLGCGLGAYEWRKTSGTQKSDQL
eukprot:1158007-Pelagomonas_calceolata.AAC.6